MKKHVSILLAVILVFSFPLAAIGGNYNGFVYKENDDGTLTITGYNNFYESSVGIPKQINGKNVTAIGNQAFMSKSSIETVSIPETVTSIGALAFYGCKSLYSVNIGKNVVSIGNKAFNSCTSLDAINLKNVVTLGDYAFYGCKMLSQLNLGTSLKTIGENAFTKCAAIISVKMPATLETISPYAFSGCEAIETLVFPDSLKFIGNSAFSKCTALSSVKFGSGELKIDSYAFENCTSLTAVTIPRNVTELGRNVFAQRETDKTEFSHDITISCYSDSAALLYCFFADIEPIVLDGKGLPEHFGDPDLDGYIDTFDARLALDHFAGISELEGEALSAADINRNDEIDLSDVRMILRKAAGI